MHKMTFGELLDSVKNGQIPSGLNPLLKSLWHDANGNWHKAHEIAQDIASADGSLIHAYLHRKEGDLWNANYWYKRAGSEMPQVSLEEEWEMLVRKFL
ncbi:MAG: hypothetical protein Kow0027_19350 [Saprospiraceae bacterium]